MLTAKMILMVVFCFCCFLNKNRTQRIARSPAGGMLPRSSTDNAGGLYQETFSRSASSVRKTAVNAAVTENGEPQDNRRTVFSSDHWQRGDRKFAL